MKNNIKFQYSLLIFPFILGITFVLAYIVLEHYNNENDYLLNQAEEIYFPNRENSILVKNKLYELQQTLQNAVSSDDDELFSRADSISTNIIFLLKNIKYESKLDTNKILISEFTDYYKFAYNISKKLVQETISIELEDDLILLVDKYNNILEKIINLSEQSKKKSKEQLSKIKHNNSESAQINLYVIIGGFFISIIITFLVSTSVVRPFRILNKELARINSLLSDKNVELEKISLELQESVQTKDKFFSIIAHDLRSPLGGLMKLTEFVVEDFDSLEKEEIREMLGAIQGSSEKVFDLLENLLEWSRMQRGVIPFDPENIKLKDIADDIKKLLKDSIAHKNIELQFSNLDLDVFADSKMLKGILRNLLSNAIKFTPNNGKVQLVANEQEKFIEVSVIDSGIGMRQDMIDNLFKIEINTSREGTNGESSSGLGLIICKEFVEKMGGKIKVESQENIGSKFSFMLPKAEITNESDL